MNISIEILRIGKQILRALYAPMKLRPMRRKITIISRQSDVPSTDIALLTDYLEKDHPDIEIKVMCRKLEGKGGPGYLLHMISQMWNISDSPVVIIDSYCIVCSILEHRKGTKIIQIWHALAAVKKFGYQSIGRDGGRSEEIAEVLCMHRNYDHIMCPSKATGRFFCQAFDADGSKMLYMGLPRIDRIVEMKPGDGGVRSEYGIPADRKILLYAPTMRKNSRLDISELAAVISEMDLQLVLRPHPHDDNIVCDSALLQQKDIIIDREGDTLSWLAECSGVITDYSAISVEAALAGKPLYFYLPDIEQYEKDEGLNVDLIQEMDGLCACDPLEMKDILEKEYPLDKLKKFRDKYVEIEPKNCTEKLGEYIYGLVEESDTKVS